MAQRGTDIHALRQKFTSILTYLKISGGLKRASIRCFAETFDVSLDTLKPALRDGRLSNELQARIAEIACFDSTSPYWHDPSVPPNKRLLPDDHKMAESYPGRDTVSAFHQYLFQQANPEILRSAEFRNLREGRTQHLNRNLALFCFSGSGQSSEMSRPLPLYLRAIIGTDEYRGIVFGFRRIRIRLLFGDEGEARVVSWLGDVAVTVKDALLSADLPMNDCFLWYLKAEEGLLKDRYAPAEPLCHLMATLVDEEFEADFSMRPQDGDITFADGQEIEDPTRRALVRRLSAKKLEGDPDRNGWIYLGRQRFKIVKGGML